MSFAVLSIFLFTGSICTFGNLQKINIYKYISNNSEILTKITITQLTFTCSNSTIETLEKGVKYVQS